MLSSFINIDNMGVQILLLLSICLFSESLKNSLLGIEVIFKLIQKFPFKMSTQTASAEKEIISLPLITATRFNPFA